jgi:uncharacterized caspase-like protein/ribosome biogenesis GTPase A
MGKYALLIGVDTYAKGLQPLPAAPKDVAALREVLLNPRMGGFDAAKPLINPTQAEMAREIELWFQSRQPEDLVLLFFSGHGIKDDRRELFFAARNTEKQRDYLIRSTATSAQFINDCISRCKARYQVLILDSCFSGAFGELVGKDDGEIPLQEQLGAEGRVVLTSTSAVDYSFEEKGTDLSIYTRYLVEGIATGAADDDSDGVITAEELHRFAGRKVQEASPVMSPKIFIPKGEGYRIKLARSPQDDPKIKYRKEAESRATSGQFSIPAKRLLQLSRQELGISDIDAEAIEAEVLKPFQEYQRKRQVYEATLQECLQVEAKLSPNVIKDLIDLRDYLRLRPEDVSAIEQVESPSPSSSDKTASHKFSSSFFSQSQAVDSSPSLDGTVSYKSHTKASPPIQETTTSSSNEIPSTFVDYRKVLATLISDLKRLRHYSQTLSLSNSIQCIDNVLERVQPQTFSVAVVGDFKRGKSTFINALLGQKVLPSDILPCSATLCRITYGLRPRVKVIYRNKREEEIAIDQLNEYVTALTPESEEVAARVKEAIIYYPASYCMNNVDIIDTPGLNNEANMTEVTLSVLPRVDAAIMVTMAQAPFIESEVEFLEKKLLTNDLGRIIFVLNGIDHISNPEEVSKHLQYACARILKLILQRAEDQYGKDSPEYEVYRKKIGKVRIFGLSASQALRAKQTGDAELLAKSRFPEFEAALENFLTYERGSAFLQVPISRLIASSTEILSTLNLRQDSQKEDLHQMGTETQRILDNAQRLSQQLLQQVNC